MSMSINLNLTPGEGEMVTEAKQRKEVATQQENDPEKVIMKIVIELNSPESNFKFGIVDCRSVRVGSYKVTDGDVGNIKVMLTTLGITFALPLANSNERNSSMKAICIPRQDILSIQANLTKKLSVIFLKTGRIYATWLRGALGMEGSPEDKHSNYYCPATGNSCQRAITLMAVGFSDADVGIIRILYGDMLKEIDYEKANRYLMDIAPHFYRSSGNYKPDSGSPAASFLSEMTGSSSGSSSGNCVSEAQGRAPGPTSVGDSDQEAPILFYEGGKTIISISPKDLTCLGHSKLVNDVMIDFWLSVIQNEILSEENRKRTFVFDSFFYSELIEKMKKCAGEDNLNAAERRHARVKTRTKNVDIFEKDFLIVPICEDGHWFIAIICFPGMTGVHDYDTLEALPTNYCYKIAKLMPASKECIPKLNRDAAPVDPNPGHSKPLQPINPEVPISGALKRKAESQRTKQPCILLLDSMADQRTRVFTGLRDYLTIEYKTKRNKTRLFDKTIMPAIMPKVPQQSNLYDGGLFILQFMESLFSHPLTTYAPQAVNFKKWFPTELAENKRREIYDFIKSKIGKQCPQNLGRLPEVNFNPGEGEDDSIDN